MTVDRLVAAARAVVARPDRGPLEELAEALADWDAEPPTANIWVAQRGYDHEGCDALGAYATDEAARAGCLAHLRDVSEDSNATIGWRHDFGIARRRGHGPDYYEVKMFPLNGGNPPPAGERP